MSIGPKRISLVAGVSRGLGAAVATAFVDRGDVVYGLSRSGTGPAGIHPLKADCTDEDQVRKAVHEIEDAYGGVDVLVHAVGDTVEEVAIEKLTLDDFMRTYLINVGSAMLLGKAVFSSLAGRSGAAVFLSSLASTYQYNGLAHYCAAKAALESYTRGLAKELAPHGARCNFIRPAVVDTELFRRSSIPAEVAAGWHALGRIGQPADIVGAVLWLTDPSTSWVTGAGVVVDGGASLMQ